MPREIRNALVASALTLMVSSTAEAQGGKPRQYADGVYTATGTYGGQPSHITLKVTLTDGVITAVEVTPPCICAGIAGTPATLCGGGSKGRHRAPDRSSERWQVGGFKRNFARIQRRHRPDQAPGGSSVTALRLAPPQSRKSEECKDDYEARN
ncbi:hypothetical protein FHT71_004139 [Rhizobium sp. BK060]|nr:hypothetical protein [Rhizobium sp. BK060]